MLTLFSKSLVVLRPMNYNLWLKSSLTISVIQPPRLLYVLLKAKTSFLRYIGYLNFIKDLTKVRFIANSSSCTITELSKLLTLCLIGIKKHVTKYCDKVFERSGRNLFWSIKNSNEVLNKLKSRQFRAFSLSNYDFSTLYTTLPHNLIKEKLNDLTEWTLHGEDSFYLACNVRNPFSLLKCIKITHYGHVRKCVKLSPFYLTIFI